MSTTETTPQPQTGKPTLEEFSFLDKGALEKSLGCQVCSRLLNVAPIMYSESLGSICGRCSSVVSTNGIGALHRQHTYEALIEILTFPCTNRTYGCPEVVKFQDVQSHERGCRFQCTNCPLSYNNLFPEKSCTWSGNAKLLADHIKVHKDDFLDPPQFEWPQTNKNMIFFTTVGNQIITVVIKHETKNKFVCLLMLIGTDLESQCFRYQLELCDEDKSNSLLLRRNRLEPICDFTECLHRPETTMEIDMDKIAEFLQNPSKVCARFGIVKKHKKEIAQITGLKDGDILTGVSAQSEMGNEKHAPPDEEMLAELECPVCNEYMIPPIYICPTGHSVCNECKSRVQLCPTCRLVFGTGRNFTLEKLTLKVRYPCRNREIGCGFVTTSDKIKHHQTVCNLSENHCVIKCGWKGLFPAMYNHFLDKHQNQLMDLDTVIQKDLKQDKNVGYYFLYTMGELFCLSYKNCGKFTVKFNVQHVGNVDGNQSFRYTVQFLMNPQQTGPCLSVSNFCQNWTDNLADSLGHGCMTVPGELFKTCVYQNHTYYIKINIVKL